MQKLTTLILILGLISCGDNIEQFVPNDISVVHTELKNIGESKSSSYKLNNNTLSTISTNMDTDIEIPINTFYNPSELSDIPYQLDIIELSSYSDYITRNITQVSDEGIRDVIHSVYVSAKDNDNKSLSIKNNKEIIIRIPSEERDGKLQIGNGYVANNSIAWSYNNAIQNLRIKYTEWTKLNSENVLEKFSGYEFPVSQTGWYSLTVIDDAPYTLNDLCVTIEDEKLNSDNTLVYVVMDSHQYLLQAQSISEDQYCSYNVPIASSTIEVISISYIENESTFYYAAMEINPNQIESTIRLSPQSVNIEDLSSSLDNL